MPLGYHTRVSTPLKPTKNIQPLPTLDPTLKGGGRIKFERRVTLLALAAGFPAVCSLCISTLVRQLLGPGAVDSRSTPDTSLAGNLFQSKAEDCPATPNSFKYSGRNS